MKINPEIKLKHYTPVNIYFNNEGKGLHGKEGAIKGHFYANLILIFSALEVCWKEK